MIPFSKNLQSQLLQLKKLKFSLRNKILAFARKKKKRWVRSTTNSFQTQFSRPFSRSLLKLMKQLRRRTRISPKSLLLTRSLRKSQNPIRNDAILRKSLFY